MDPLRKVFKLPFLNLVLLPKAERGDAPQAVACMHSPGESEMDQVLAS